MATEDARYRETTQFRLWSFSPAQLAELREETNKLARLNLSEKFAATTSQTVSSAEQSSANTPNPHAPVPSISTPLGATGNLASAPAEIDSLVQNGASTANANLPDFLTAAEELQMLKFFTVELLKAADFCRLPTDIRATAAIFFRRFYVTNSIMTYPPAEMFKTCLFFACKAEGIFSSLDAFAEQFPNTTRQQIMGGEFLLCQGIRFAFDVKHPYRALEGALMQLRGLEGVEDERIDRAGGKARNILKFSPLVTDAYFHFTPSQIMFAALMIADEELLDAMMDHTFPKHLAVHEGTTKAEQRAAEKGGQVKGQEMKRKVLGAIELCRDMLLQEPPERYTDYWGTKHSKETFRPLTKKLKKCRDPDRQDLAALQKARKEVPTNGEKKAKPADTSDIFNPSDEDRESKRPKLSTKLDDPFGGPL